MPFLLTLDYICLNYTFILDVSDLQMKGCDGGYCIMGQKCNLDGG